MCDLTLTRRMCPWRLARSSAIRLSVGACGLDRALRRPARVLYATSEVIRERESVKITASAVVGSFWSLLPLAGGS